MDTYTREPSRHRSRPASSRSSRAARQPRRSGSDLIIDLDGEAEWGQWDDPSYHSPDPSPRIGRRNSAESLSRGSKAVRDPYLDSASGRPWWRPPRWLCVAVTAALLIPTLVSYGSALTAPGNSNIAIRSTEWMRSHHYRWLVSGAENVWYRINQPKTGGRPKGAAAAQLTAAARQHSSGTSSSGSTASSAGQSGSNPSAGSSSSSVGSSSSSGSSASSSSGVLSSSAPLPAPAPIKPFVAHPMPGEGQWRPLGRYVNGHPAMYVSYLRPDAIHTSLVASVAWIDPRLVRAMGFAGLGQPGGTGWAHQAPIPDSMRPNLLAAFNSGFKMQDAKGGYYMDGRYAAPLRPGAATVTITHNGVINVGAWDKNFSMSPNIAYARQNLNLIVNHGKVVPGVDTTSVSKWGVTVGNAVYVWRSGIGITSNGAIVYVASPGLTAASLAHLLVRAGAVRGMELDINSAWVSFFTYSKAAPGLPASDLTVTKLLADMVPNPHRYLTPSNRDFVALFAR